MPLTQQVIVNGVTVDMFDDTQPAKMFPMRATLAFIEDSPYTEASPGAIQALREAGVTKLPLYRSEADAAGIDYSPLRPAHPEGQAGSIEGTV